MSSLALGLEDPEPPALPHFVPQCTLWVPFLLKCLRSLLSRAFYTISKCFVPGQNLASLGGLKQIICHVKVLKDSKRKWLNKSSSWHFLTSLPSKTFH